MLHRWFSQEQLAANRRASLASDLKRALDMELAEGFARFCPVDGARPSHYMNVLVPFRAGEALLGIRFKGLDITRPFADVVATSVPVTTEEEVAELRDIACQTYSVFSPGHVRFSVFSPEALGAFGRSGTWEKKYLIGGLAEMKATAEPRYLNRVELRQASNLDFFDSYLGVYRELIGRNPEHAEYATAGDREDLQYYLSDGSVFEVLIDGRWAGVVAGYGHVDSCIEGFYVTENVLSAEFRGRGFGCAVQRRFVEAVDPAHRVIFGTVHVENGGAYNAALRSGRVDVGGYCWVEPLEAG